MLQAILCGYIGADAEIKVSDGHEFCTFRVAHSERWTDESGQSHENTTWVDCSMDGRPKVFEYLKRGTLVYISGPVRTRVYSSAKDRCMKAGITISVRSLELLGGKPDVVPTKVVDESGTLHDVSKWYYCPDLVRGEKEPEVLPVFSTRGDAQFSVDRNGWVTPVQNNSQTDENENAQS